MKRRILYLVLVLIMNLSIKTKAQTAFIPVDSANKMIQSYLGSISSVTGNMDLKSIIFDADSIRSMLTGTAGSQVKSVRIFFAHTLPYINSVGPNINCAYTSGELTLIIAGYDASGNYIYCPAGMVLDTGIPCPPNCPSTGEAAADTLPN